MLVPFCAEVLTEHLLHLGRPIQRHGFELVNSQTEMAPDVSKAADEFVHLTAGNHLEGRRVNWLVRLPLKLVNILHARLRPSDLTLKLYDSLVNTHVT
eukprot:1798580-Prymnesium_polylepis.1